MRYALCLVLVLASSAYAINRDQMNRAMDGEDLNTVLSPPKRQKPKPAMKECFTSGDCGSLEVCYIASKSDAKGVCVKRPEN